MDFSEVEWDENKRLKNIEKHGLDFVDAVEVLDGPCLCVPARQVHGEARSMAIDKLGDIAVSIIFTMRESVLRVISMRKARDGERRHYEEVFGG